MTTFASPRRALAALVSSLVLNACGANVPMPGGDGSTDALREDASMSDATSMDAAASDASSSDAATSDGAPADALHLGDAGGACPQAPTAESLRAAHAALRGGADAVSLSPDGCVRYARTTRDGLVTREEVTAAGRSIVLWDHTAALSTGRRDENADGVFEWRSTVTRSATDERVEITIDPSGTGATPTRRETYVRVGTRVRARIEVAATPGGALTVDSEFETTGLSQPFVTAPTTGTGTGSCTPAQAMQLQMQMEAAMQTGMTCSSRLGLNAMSNHAAQIAATRGIELRCARLTPNQSRCAEVNHWDAITSLLQTGRTTPLVITVDPDAFFNDARCSGNQLNVLWHEILHTYIGLHDPYDPEDAPQTTTRDRVYACSALCFSANATKCQCASCLGTNICDPRCAGFRDCNPDLGAQCRCAARPRWYPTLTQCNVECPSGLACAFATCRAVSYACN
ncbi:MAG: hypothetical protein JNK05_36760 [Myxococcales bacterium]|nr:hypothetical protein [Myxococcales bacterium]